jgi:hypothetical protein
MEPSIARFWGHRRKKILLDLKVLRGTELNEIDFHTDTALITVVTRRFRLNSCAALQLSVSMGSLLNNLDNVAGRVPCCGGNPILKYPSLKYFLENCLITKDLDSAKA